MRKSFIIYRLIIITTLGTGLMSCKKFLKVDSPIQQITGERTFSNDITANSAITGIYSRLSQNSFIRDLTPFCGMYADELEYYIQDGPRTEFAQSRLSLTSSPTLNSSFWLAPYQFIYMSNVAIEQLEQGTGLSENVKKGLIGEAKFIRAYLYLQLSSLYGNLPLTTSSDYELNSSLSRSDKDKIIQQVISDLQSAINLLPEKIDPEKIRANKWAAMALLARTYLYHKDYALAEQISNELISSGNYTLAADLTRVFLKNSTEAILQFQPTQTNQNTPDGLTFLPASSSETPKFLIRPSLVNSFEQGDLRKNNWIGTRQFLGQTIYYPAKYKILNTATLSEYQMILRLGEQYLIRAESRIENGDIAGGIADLNIIRKRSRALASASVPNPLPALATTIGLEQARLAVEKERRFEMMFEMGSRWFDLKRTQRANAVLGLEKPITWRQNAVLWPLPDEQLKLNPLLTQNNGY